MAIKLNELEATGTRWQAPSADYPQGSFINGTGQGKRDGSYAKAEWANDLFGAIGAVLKNGGQTPNGQVETANNSQFFNALKAIIKNDIDTLGGDPSAVASGSVNAITATFTKPITLEGGKMVKVRAIGANTSPTVTFNPNGLGAKQIVKGGGKALAVGDIAGAGYWLTMIYDATLQKWVLQNPATGVTLVLPEASESTKGIVQLATQSEVTNGTDVPKAITPKQFKEATKDLGGGLPMGHLFAWPFQTPPDGCIQCNGATYSRVLYEDFWNYISSKGWVKTEAEWQSLASANGGYCPYYSTGDGSTTFRTPKFAPFMQVAIASANVGTYHQAGLPNIKGDLPAGENSSVVDIVMSGAFYQDGTNTNRGLNSDHDNRQAHFDASRSNPIYGRSTTVQPESHEWMICVVVLGNITNIGSADISQVISSFANIQAEFSEIKEAPVLGASDYIKQTWKSGTSWYRVWSDGWIEQGGCTGSPFGTSKTISLNKSFTNTDYTIVIGSAGGSESTVKVSTLNKTTSSFVTFRHYSGDGRGSGNAYWVAFGY